MTNKAKDTGKAAETKAAEATGEAKAAGTVNIPKGASMKPATFAEQLVASGFKEQNPAGDSTPSDYAIGWNSLSESKPTTSFTKGKKRIELTLEPNGGAAPMKHLKIYNGEDVMWHSVDGIEPSEEFMNKHVLETEEK